ncbi:hypothetical protein [Kitasatospora sp. NPDC057015]|uniref:hypothetical protein n=1 Tax=Kitasatospora sp. NPDC057015 TaxID=3346001 RepID=UPI00362D1D1E
MTDAMLVPRPSRLRADEGQFLLHRGWRHRWVFYACQPLLQLLLAAVYDDFRTRLAAHLPRLGAVGVEFRRETGPLPWQTRPGIEGKPSTRLEWAAFIDQLVAHVKI